MHNFGDGAEHDECSQRADDAREDAVSYVVQDGGNDAPYARLNQLHFEASSSWVATARHLVT